MMDRTRTAHLIPEGRGRDEAKKAEDLSYGDPGPDFSIANAWHGGDLQGPVKGVGVGGGEATVDRVRDRGEEPVPDPRGLHQGTSAHPLRIGSPSSHLSLRTYDDRPRTCFVP